MASRPPPGWIAPGSPTPTGPIRRTPSRLAACAAALGETRAALAALELALLHPVVGRVVRDNARLYEANDWDRLRGDPRFESLFPR